MYLYLLVNFPSRFFNSIYRFFYAYSYQKYFCHAFSESLKYKKAFLPTKYVFSFILRFIYNSPPL